MTKIDFKPKQVVKKLLTLLPDRTKDVIVKRFGLGNETKKMTLDAIGKKYGITRERVRQIEETAIQNIKKSDIYQEQQTAFNELEEFLNKIGGVVAEEDFLELISKDAGTQNHIHFMLVLGDPFNKHKEDEHFRHSWNINEELAGKVCQGLESLYANLSDDDLVSEPDLIKMFLDHLQDIADEYREEEILKRWLSMSKKIGRNQLGEWGLTSSPNVRSKGIRDYTFLVLKKHGSPIHFSEVAKTISKMFDKDAHVATTHNELIKDPRFVLVGRGLYALKEWGYVSGVVRDVLKTLIDKNGPMNKEDIIDKVLKERYVKENTIMVNLNNPKYFKKNKDGTYSIV